MAKLVIFIFITILPVLIAIDCGRLKLASGLFLMLMAPVLLYVNVYPIPYVSEIQIAISILALIWLVKAGIFAPLSKNTSDVTGEMPQSSAGSIN